MSENGSEPIGGSLALTGTGATYGALTWTKQGVHSFGSLGLITPTAPPVPPVRISEIHYDNAGADTGEAIEVTGPANVDLTGWSLELHNGKAIGDTVYDTVGLIGVLLDEVGCAERFGRIGRTYTIDVVVTRNHQAVVDSAYVFVLPSFGGSLAQNGPQ